MNMKKAAVIVCAVLFFAGMTLAQTPQTQDKGKSTTPAKVETKKDSKASCDPKTCTKTGMKSGCCAGDNQKKEEKKAETKAPEKK